MVVEGARGALKKGNPGPRSRRRYLILTIRTWGDGALFTIPHLRSEPRSYGVPTPSALKGLLRSIFGKPEFEWEIERVHVMNPVGFDSYQVKRVKSRSHVERQEDGSRKEDSTLQRITHLVDVEYFIEARIVANPHRTGRTSHSYMQEAKRRMDRGEQFRKTCFGRMEFGAYWQRWEDPIPKAAPINLDEPSLLFDLAPTNMRRDKWDPIYFHGKVRDGIMEVPRDLYDRHRETLMLARAKCIPHKKGN